jgi:RHS repeat-associated protein
VSYTVDDAGRTSSASGPSIYANSIAYAADGRLAQMMLGNGLWETREYNTPGTTINYKLGIAPGDGSKVLLGYNFNATNNNGNVVSHTISRGGGNWTQSYDYDGVNRLQNMSEGAISRTYGYDQYGNRWVTGSLPDWREPTSPGNFNASNNRLAMSGITYDDAGNQTAYSGFTIGYDAENRITSMTSGSGSDSFYYDGDGRRVKKVWTSGGTTTRTYYVYDALGRMAVEYSTEAPANTGMSYLFTDMLGSVRAITSSNQQVTECYDYLPFGRMLGASVNGRGSLGCYPTDPDNGYSSRTPQKFTGKERDVETGLDYFGARYYSGAQGRFTSVDPVNITPGRMLDPQQLNLYSYVRNNPLKYLDPDGETLVVSGDINKAKEELCKIIGGDCSRINYDEKSRIITVDIDGLEPNNEGANLIDELATDSKNTYSLTIGEQIATKGGMRPIKGEENLDNNPDWRYGKGKRDIQLPPTGIDSAVGYNPKYSYYEKEKLVPAYRIIFHELAEAYAKVIKGMQYVYEGEKWPGTGAHNDAIERERKLPYVKSEGMAGGSLIRVPK